MDARSGFITQLYSAIVVGLRRSLDVVGSAADFGACDPGCPEQ